jgi:chemotaxis protein MotB
VRSRRRSRIADHPISHERWLVSYADFVTLLFAFFTVLYASSTVDTTKLEAVGDSIQEVFAGPSLNPVVNVAPKPAVIALTPVKPAQQEKPNPGQELARVEEQLLRDLAGEIAEGRVSLAQDQRGLVISIPEAGSFATGSADLPPKATALFSALGARLRVVPNAIRVEGHTDDVPIHTPRYESNWDLSTARATAVVAFLIEVAGVDPGRLSAAGYAEFRPRAANDSPANRATNRRVDLVILNPATRSAEEPAVGR